VEARSGRFRRAVPVKPGEKEYELALDATLKQAVRRQARTGKPSREGLALPVERTPSPVPSPPVGDRAPEGPVRGWSSGSRHEVFRRILTPGDLCKKQRRRPCDHLIVLAVDSSDSMGDGTETRMKAAKGAVLAILRKAYQNRSEVALVAFGGEQARVVLPPTRSISLAQHQLKRLPTGGATPFADGLFKAWQLIRAQRLKNPGVRPVLVIISDGEANVPMTEGAPALPELFSLAGKIARDRLVSVLIDVVAEMGKAIEMRRLAAELRASYVKVTELKPKHILDVVSQAGSKA
jgi:magnesium chelatase subunit D